MISLDSDGDGKEDAGGQTQVAEALSQVVEPEREARHAESHLGMIIDHDHLDMVEDGVGVDDHYSHHHHHGLVTNMLMI